MVERGNQENRDKFQQNEISLRRRCLQCGSSLGETLIDDKESKYLMEGLVFETIEVPHPQGLYIACRVREKKEVV